MSNRVMTGCRLEKVRVIVQSVRLSCCFHRNYKDHSNPGGEFPVILSSYCPRMVTTSAISPETFLGGGQANIIWGLRTMTTAIDQLSSTALLKVIVVFGRGAYLTQFWVGRCGTKRSYLTRGGAGRS